MKLVRSMRGALCQIIQVRRREGISLPCPLMIMTEEVGLWKYHVYEVVSDKIEFTRLLRSHVKYLRQYLETGKGSLKTLFLCMCKSV